MPKKISVYLKDENMNKLQEYRNRSKVVNRALNEFFSNKTHIKSKLMELEEEEKLLEYKLKINRIKRSECEEMLEQLMCETKSRPDEYECSVNILKNIDNVCVEDFEFQAERLGVTLETYRKWLINDGFYDEILYSS